MYLEDFGALRNGHSPLNDRKVPSHHQGVLLEHALNRLQYLDRAREDDELFSSSSTQLGELPEHNYFAAGLQRKGGNQRALQWLVSQSRPTSKYFSEDWSMKP